MKWRDLVIAAVAVIAVFLYLAANQLERSERSRSAELRVADSVLHVHDAAYRQQIDSLTEIAGNALARADRAAFRQPQIVERIREVAGDSAAVIVKLDSLVFEHNAEVAGLRDAIISKDSAFVLLGAQLRETVMVKDQALVALSATEDALERSEHRRKIERIALGGVIVILAIFR